MSSKFSSPFMAKSPLNQGEIKDASEILGDQPGYNKKTNTVMQAGNANMPYPGSGHGLGRAMAAATALAAPVVVNMPKIMDKKDELVENVSTFVTDKVIPKVQKVKAKVGGKIRRAVGMDKHIYPGSSGA